MWYNPTKGVDFVENTALRLQKIMKDRNLKQVDILRLSEPYCKKYNIKLNKSDLSQFVNGKFTPGQWKLTILGLALNVSEAWLMGYDVPMERTQQPPTAEDERLLDNELINRIHQLTPDELEKGSVLVQGLLAARRA